MNLQELDAGFHELSRMAQSESGVPIRRCLELVEQATGVSILDLISERRSKRLARARQLAMWLARHATLKSTAQIGRVMHKDHSTVIHGTQLIDRLRAENPEMKALSDRLLSELLPDGPSTACAQNSC